jgi:type IV pilus assembly protein PilZ
MIIEKSFSQKQTIADINQLERRDCELWTMAILMILVLMVFIFISHIWEMADSSREWFRQIESLKLYFIGSTFLVLLFCLYVINKHLELRRLRKELFIQKTELEQVANALEEVTAFYQISSVIITKQSLTTILENITQESLKCLKADRSSIYRVDGEKGYLTRQITYASNPMNENVNLLEEKEVARKAVLQNRPFLLDKPEDFANFFKYVEREEKINSLMCIPVLSDGKPIGGLSVARINKKYSFHEEDMKKLSVFSNYASMAIENSNLFEELQKKIKNRKNYEEFFAHIEELLQGLVETERKEIEEYKKNILPKRKDQGEIKITLMSELNAERRQDERIEEILQVEIENDILAQTANISEGGVFIHTQNPLDLEEEFFLKLHIPDGKEPMEVLCRVVWTNKYGKESEELPRGMGVKFLKLRDESKRRIEEFIKMQKSKKLLEDNETTP